MLLFAVFIPIISAANGALQCNSTLCRGTYFRSGCATLSTCGECLPYYNLNNGKANAPGNTPCTVICNVNNTYCTELHRLPCSTGADQMQCGNCINIFYTSSSDGPGLTPCNSLPQNAPILAYAQRVVMKFDYDCNIAQSNVDPFLIQIINDLAFSSNPPISADNIDILDWNCPTVTLVVEPSVDTSYITPTTFVNQMMSQIRNPGSPLLSGVITSQAATFTATEVVYQYCKDNVWREKGQCPSDDEYLKTILVFGVGGFLILGTLLLITYQQCCKKQIPQEEEEVKVIPLQDMKPQLNSPASKPKIKEKEKHPSIILKTKSQKSFRTSLALPSTNHPRNSNNPRRSPPTSPTPGPTSSRPTSPGTPLDVEQDFGGDEKVHDDRSRHSAMW